MRHIWFCKAIIDTEKPLSFGADTPPRLAVRNAIYEMFGEYPQTIFSGFGCYKLTKSEEKFVNKRLKEIKELANFTVSKEKVYED